MGRQLKLAQVESEILQYSSSANFPQPTGSIKYLYLDQSANTLYRWDALSGLNGEYVLLNSATTPPTSGSAEGELYFADLVTSARLMPCTYNNGVSGSGATLISTGSIALGQFNQPGKIDNTTPLVDDIILVRSETSTLRHGLYSITDLGSPTSSFVLTRVSYYDTGSEVYPSQITGLRGATGANQTYIQQTPNPIVGSSPIVFLQSPSTSTQTLPILFIDTVTTAPLPLSTYATGSTYVGFPGAGATLTATASGALGVIGGITASSGVRLLAVSESNPVQNGSYTVTAPGSATTPWKLTRIDYWTSMQPNIKEFVVSRFGATEYGSRYVLQSSSITPANIGISQSLIFQKYLSPSTGGGITSAFPFTGSAIITGSLTITGSIIATTGFTGSLQGTASFATSASWAPSVATAVGPFGIANSSGSYTYYNTFSASMAAATSGQTVEMFADVVETGSITVTLKNEVNINGNGHTYTLNNSGTINALTVTNGTSIECSVLNLTVIRTGGTVQQSQNACLFTGTGTSGNIYLTGSKFTNSGSGSGIAIGSASTISIYDGTAIANTTFGSIYIESSAGAKVYNSTGISTSQTGINCYIGGDLFNCTGISSSGIGIDGAGATTAGNQYNCIGISSTNYGLTTGLISINCIGRSTTNNGIYSISSKLYNCTGISVSGRGIQNVGTLMYNFQGISSSNVGILLQSTTSVAYNCFSKSDSSYSIWGWQGSSIFNSIIECNWNNAGGNGIQGNGGFITSTIINCVFKLSNTLATYLNNGGTAQAISMKGNTYTGGAPFNPNLTQAITATQDNQGNIYL